MKTWKLHDTKSLSEQTGGYLPTSFNELLIIIHRNHSGSSYQRLSPILIPYEELGDTGVTFNANTQVWGTGYCAFVTVSKTAWNALKLRQIKPNDTTVTEISDGVINIYYK